jgi:hypothetical protein
MKMMKIKQSRVLVSRQEVTAFNSRWPCSELRDSHTYWFEFDDADNLIDTNVDVRGDGSAASAMADDCRHYLKTGEYPEWAIQEVTK